MKNLKREITPLTPEVMEKIVGGGNWVVMVNKGEGNGWESRQFSTEEGARAWYQMCNSTGWKTFYRETVLI